LTPFKDSATVQGGSFNEAKNAFDYSQRQIAKVGSQVTKYGFVFLFTAFPVNPASLSIMEFISQEIFLSFKEQ